MTSLIGIHSISKSHGSKILFEDLSFTICQGDRIGLVGPNGAGKTTLLKILVGLEKQNSGNISKRQGLKIGYASQIPEFDPLPVEEILMQNAPEDDYEMETRAQILLSKAEFQDPKQNAATLSGGWKKRLDIIRALMQKPDLLILDEPTNHLDLGGILWLEKFLKQDRLTYMIVSHDRSFLNNVSNKIIEVNPCYPEGLFISVGGMEAYLELKNQFLEGQEKQEQVLRQQVKNEVDWLRRSPKARTTKSQSRIDRAHNLIDELGSVEERNKKRKVGIDFTASDRQTRKLLVAKNISKSLGGKTLFSGLDVTLSPGTCLGVLGENGMGKTTLLKILAGLIQPDAGTVKPAQDLKIVYFDQHRETISPNITLKEALSPNSDMVNYRGQQIHVNGWAKRFLFSPDRLTLPVQYLSGGERARILIARLMLQPADVLFLDEPTNDLDIQTLEIIEESLASFNGAVVLITHDRSLMTNTCTQILSLSQGQAEFFSDYSQYEKSIAKRPKVQEVKPKETVKSTPVKKLSYTERKELETMEARIMEKEAEVDHLKKLLEEPPSDPKAALELYQKLADSEHELTALFDRWQSLS